MHIEPRAPLPGLADEDLRVLQWGAAVCAEVCPADAELLAGWGACLQGTALLGLNK